MSEVEPTTQAAGPITEAQVEAEFEGMEVDAPRVGIIMGSKSDMETMEKAGAVLDEYRIRYEIRVMSAHRDPEMVAEYCKNYEENGMKVQLKHLPHMVGYYFTEVGGLNTMVHLWAYDSLDQRDKCRAAMQADPEWKKLSGDPAYKDTVSQITNLVLRPVAGSQV